ncbi:MAG: hypothetical protein EKK46_15155 [Rhodocyclaceae bacterium]|nr:MAG: hypothetical protein EKK46_15155 [Rhodocyclaceae bacterium]
MTIATREHLRAFEAVTTEIILVRNKLAAFGIDSAALVQYNAEAGNIDGAAAAGLVALDRLAAEFTRLMDGFERAVADLMGERPKLGESSVDFFGRIYNMRAGGWFELAKSNSVSLNLDEGVARTASKATRKD